LFCLIWVVHGRTPTLLKVAVACQNRFCEFRFVHVDKIYILNEDPQRSEINGAHRSGHSHDGLNGFVS
jgi:hypothetical protein